MKKEALSMDKIKQDLIITANSQGSNIENHRLSFIIPFELLSIILGVFTKNILIALAIFLPAAYNIVFFIIECRNSSIKKKAIMNVIDRGDIAVSIEQFSHIAEETIYEPHSHGNHAHSTKIVKFFYFKSGAGWRIPDVRKHYSWSKDYYVTTRGLENISIPGDEFYFITLQGYFDISYIYPCKNFIFDEKINP